jgi:hypothetical protein
MFGRLEIIPLHELKKSVPVGFIQKTLLLFTFQQGKKPDLPNDRLGIDSQIPGQSPLRDA